MENPSISQLHDSASFRLWSTLWGYPGKSRLRLIPKRNFGVGHMAS